MGGGRIRLTLADVDVDDNTIINNVVAPFSSYNGISNIFLIEEPHPW